MITGGDECDIPYIISSTYKNFSPIIKKNGEIHCKDVVGKCGKWAENETIDEELITDDAPIHLADGLYIGDDSGIVNMVYELQDKFPKVKHIKAVAFENNGSSNNPTLPDMLTIAIGALFGKGTACSTNTQQTKDSVNIGLPGVSMIDMHAPQCKIFDGNHCSKSRRIFNGVYDNTDIWSDDRNCNPFTTLCTAQVHIDVWSGVPTVDNNQFGVKAGYSVDLFVINVRVGTMGAPIFVLPTDLQNEDVSDFTAILNGHSEHVNKIMRSIPQDIYDVVFGDAEYCPDDFPVQSSWTNYYVD